MSHVVELRQAFYMPQSSGVSAAAQEVDRMSTNVILDVRLRPSGRQQAVDELKVVANQQGMFGTYEGLQTIDRAMKFIACIPLDVSVPFISIDPDGEIAFDWEAEDDLFSVSLSCTGKLTYAIDVDGNRSAGNLFFGAELPTEVLGVLSAFPADRA